ncbi:MAG: hypothetical protein ACI9HY_000777 [Planctomycetaceae bacterium]|jgi:hypothetical protein
MLAVIAVNDPQKVLQDRCLSKPGNQALTILQISGVLQHTIGRRIIIRLVAGLPHMLSFIFIEVGNIQIACYLAIA